MKCPRTGNSLKTLKVGGIAIEISESAEAYFLINWSWISLKIQVKFVIVL